MIEATKEMLRQQDKQIEQMRAAVATIGAQPFADLNLARHALTDLDTVRNALSMGGSGLGLLDDVNRTLRRGGYSLGLLDDVNQALSGREQRRRVREQRQVNTDQQVQGVLLRLRPEPEPPAERVQVVSLPAAGDWREVITSVITTGQASPAEVGALLYSISVQQRPAGPVPPAWAEIEAVAVMYRDNGHRYKNQGRFVEYLANKGMAIGLSTFKEWIRLYEQYTGVKLRPGQGSRKRKPIVG